MPIISNLRVVAWVAALTAVALLLMPLPARAQVAEPDDAGSGRDAGADFSTAVPIEPGAQYTATLSISAERSGFDAVTDYDWFTFDARAGQYISADVTAPVAGQCGGLIAPDGSEIADYGCSGALRNVVAPMDGTYALTVGTSISDHQPYTFDVKVHALPIEVDMGTPTQSAGPGQVVVAVADTGVNPYHQMYARPQNTAHPCTWVEGFDDCSIPALELSIGEYETYAEAYEADREIWDSLELHQWYWIPGTNIIGAVCEGSTNVTGQAMGETNDDCILDNQGHGTATTSAVLTEAPDALLLVHDGNSGAYDLESAPVVPDVQSHSWGPYVPLPAHAAGLVYEELTGEPWFDAEGAYDAETIFFIAAGNYAPFPTFLDWERVNPAIQTVGGGSPGSWTPMSWSAFDFASWFCRPVAVHDDLDGYDSSACGTSVAAPTAAGTAAAALLEIRRREGTTLRSTPEMVSETVSRDAFIAALRAGATYDPEADRFPKSALANGFPVPVVKGAEHLSWGYGWLDRTRVDAIVACALDDVCPAKSAEAEQYNATRQEIRRASTTDPVG